VLGLTRIGRACQRLSVIHVTDFGSTLSCRSFVRGSATLSLLNFCQFASGVSLRSVARLGSHISVTGTSCIRGAGKKMLSIHT
jgi:hypothetical protein